ncbi:efflux RND transporter periplasmic adaptor subunit [Vibrio tapetis subsp. quintayensis]|uniref:efflux RND transporter periplasmic adaptor subunit n=1 Tax=Vibrio tapetis TaxID=52443 RepID=UPI0025B3637D|nr:efflux RND transporter periplasmic adaptor subunit [Vibrio tapetis]MDN3682821.1 efflux RND transporter periplasmic adaptor subunit [Vibrio tapetis subsp. quintayensis]
MRTSAKLLIATMPFTLLACNSQTQHEPDIAQALPQVSVLTLAMQQAPQTEQFVGKTQATEKVDIVPKVSGYLVSRNFVEGDVVEKGALLYQIDPVPFQIEVDRRTATLAQMDAQFQIADKKLVKAKQLVKNNALTEIELDQIEAERRELEAQVHAALADLNRAKLDLSYTQITAPFEGIVGASNVSPGSLVGPSNPAMTRLVSNQNMYVNIQLDEKQYLNDLQDKAQRNLDIVAPEISLKLSNGVDYKQPGEINFIDNRVDSSNGTITFRVIFPNPDSLLVPGQFVTLVTTDSQSDLKIVIPQSAVQEDQRGRYVLTVNEESLIESKYIQLGERLDQNWIVESGLDAGEQLIVKGLQQARPGLEANVISKG